jgi:hypothetical protein
MKGDRRRAGFRRSPYDIPEAEEDEGRLTWCVLIPQSWAGLSRQGLTLKGRSRAIKRQSHGMT